MCKIIYIYICIYILRSRRSPLIPDLRWASGAIWRLGSERGEIGQPDAKGATRLEVVAQEVAPGPAAGPAAEVLRFEAFCRKELQRTAQSCTPPHGNPRGLPFVQKRNIPEERTWFCPRKQHIGDDRIHFSGAKGNFRKKNT